MIGVYILLLLLLSYGCDIDGQWKESSPNWIQVFTCNSGFKYRVCNAMNQWDEIQNHNCICSSSDNCLQEVYHGEIHQTLSESSNPQLNSPRIISSTPNDMDSNVSVLSSITIHFSSSMHRGNGNGFIQSQDGMIMNELFMKTSCIGAVCTISFNKPLQSNSFYQLEFDADFFINEYNLPLQDSFRLLFKTNSQSCGVQSIQDGFDNSHLCSCFSDHNACLCDCGAVQINRGF